MNIVRYTEKEKERWDCFVSFSRNATFLFLRSFLDYHQDRFVDCSLMIETDKGDLLALFPATLHRGTHSVHSHGGLTYGGLLLASKTTTRQVLEMMEQIVSYYSTYAAGQIHQLLIKPIPHIYHQLPSEEELYAFFRLGAKLVARGASSAIDLQQNLSFSTLRSRKYRKGQKGGLQLVEGGNLEEVWQLISDNLQERYGVPPTHTYQEMRLLMEAFPNNIRLFTVQTIRGELQAATLLFLSPRVAHAQYIVASPKGKETGALDFLFIELISKLQQRISHFTTIRYFDFGISTEDNGYTLNEGLIFQKEGFGAHTVVYDQYAIDLTLCNKEYHS